MDELLADASEDAQEALRNAVLEGLQQAERDFDIRTNVIICGLRDRFESASMRQAELAAAYREAEEAVEDARQPRGQTATLRTSLLRCLRLCCSRRVDAVGGWTGTYACS